MYLFISLNLFILFTQFLLLLVISTDSLISRYVTSSITTNYSLFKAILALIFCMIYTCCPDLAYNRNPCYYSRLAYCFNYSLAVLRFLRVDHGPFLWFKYADYQYFEKLFFSTFICCYHYTKSPIFWGFCCIVLCLRSFFICVFCLQLVLFGSFTHRSHLVCIMFIRIVYLLTFYPYHRNTCSDDLLVINPTSLIVF